MNEIVEINSDGPILDSDGVLHVPSSDISYTSKKMVCQFDIPNCVIAIFQVGIKHRFVQSTIRVFIHLMCMISFGKEILMKKLKIYAAKELARGVFWITDDGLLAFPYYEDNYIGVAKSGMTFNHKKLWKELQGTRGKSYNYYPRGRVDIDNKGRAVIYMNPNIDETWIPKIKVEFGIVDDPIIRYDYSQHYKCYLDDGWEAEK